MCDLFDDLMPAGFPTRHPQGACSLPRRCPYGLPRCRSFREGIGHKIAVLPGMPFFVDGGGEDTIRLNFSNAGEEEQGMHRLRGYKRAFVNNPSSRADRITGLFYHRHRNNFCPPFFRQAVRQQEKSRPAGIFHRFFQSCPLNPSFIYASSARLLLQEEIV